MLKRIFSANTKPAVKKVKGAAKALNIVPLSIDIGLASALGKSAASGLQRLLQKSKTNLEGYSVKDGAVSLSLKNDVGSAQANVSVRTLEMIAPLFISHPSQEAFDEINENRWQIKASDAVLPLCLLPLNVAIWKAAGLGQEMVGFCRSQEFDFGKHHDRLHFQMGEIGRRFGIHDERTREEYLAAVSSLSVPRKEAVLGWMRYEWNTQGTTLFVREELKRLSSKIDFSGPQLMEMAAYFCDAGEYGQALKMAKAAKKKNAAIWEDHRIPAVTRLLAREKLLKSHWALEDADFCDSIEAAGGEFPTLLRENLDSFAIVANGPSQFGRSTGPLIDGKNIVVRMNNGGRARVEHGDDYGLKQNVWLRSLQNYDILRVEKIPDIERVIISGPNPLYRRPNSATFLKEIVRIYGNVHLVPEEYLRTAIRECRRSCACASDRLARSLWSCLHGGAEGMPSRAGGTQGARGGERGISRGSGRGWGVRSRELVAPCTSSKRIIFHIMLINSTAQNHPSP